MSSTRSHRKENIDVDNHHIFFYRRSYQRTSAKELRNYWYCKAPIKRDLHRELHALCGEVPIPRKINVEEALFQLIQLSKYNSIHPDDPLRKRLEILIFLFSYAEPEVVDALDQQLRIIDRWGA